MLAQSGDQFEHLDTEKTYNELESIYSEGIGLMRVTLQEKIEEEGGGRNRETCYNTM